ncbi:MAG: SurA N-terminal domain-containing protein [Nitrospinota bacterium]
MVQINFARKEVSCKLVYYGPGMSGKTTNLEVVHQKVPQNNKGDLVAIATEGDRTLFFDFLPLDLGTVRGMKTKFQLYTVPGQVYYASTRKLVLQGADGVIFVADSQKSKLAENQESLKDLLGNLQEYGIDVNSFPLVIQWNKRDLPDAAEVEWLDENINHLKATTTEAVAATGEGVMGTLKTAAGLVLERLNEQSGAALGTPPKAAAAKKEPVKKEEPVVAVVNGDAIKKNYFVNYCQMQYRLGATGDVEDFKKMSREETLGCLDKLINYSLLMKEAKKSGYLINKQNLEAQVMKFIKKIGSKEKFQEFLKKRLLSMDVIKNEAVKNLVVTDMLKKMHNNLKKMLEVTREEANEYYESNKERFPGGLENDMGKITTVLKNMKKRKLLDGLYEKLRLNSEIKIHEDRL